MKKFNFNHYSLITIVGFLLIIGLVIMASVSTIYSQERFGQPYYFLARQVIHIALGLILAFMAYKVKLDLIRKWSSFVLIINMVLLAAVFVPGVGVTIGGAQRWIQLGPLGIQPVEFFKLSFVVFVSAWMANVNSPIVSQKKRKGRDRFNFRPIIISLSAFIISAIILVLQPNISNLGIIFAVTIIIYFLSGAPLWHTAILIGVGLSGLGLIIKMAPHVINRLLVYFDPSHDPMGMGYQTKQALIAIGSGGIFGLGLGMSRQKLGFLPETMSDTIFAILAEEVGFAGSLTLLFFFVAFLLIGFKISKESSDKFCSLTAAGITSWIIIQAFVNIGAMLGIIPLTGTALPFISYGGSHLITELTAVGLLLNISRNRDNIIRTN